MIVVHNSKTGVMKMGAARHSQRSQWEAWGEFSFLHEEQGTLEWIYPEKGTCALESIAVPLASSKLSLAMLGYS